MINVGMLEELKLFVLATSDILTFFAKFSKTDPCLQQKIETGISSLFTPLTTQQPRFVLWKFLLMMLIGRRKRMKIVEVGTRKKRKEMTPKGHLSNCLSAV